jgi:hypothetical protein
VEGTNIKRVAAGDGRSAIVTKNGPRIAAFEVEDDCVPVETVLELRRLGVWLAVEQYGFAACPFADTLEQNIRPKFARLVIRRRAVCRPVLRRLHGVRGRPTMRMVKFAERLRYVHWQSPWTKPVQSAT